MNPAPLHRYRIHGLVVASALALPDLPPAPDGAPANVGIEIGAVPGTLDAPTRVGACFEVKPERLLIGLDGEARFLVSDGRTIRVELAPGSDPAEVRRLLLSSPLGALLLQRGLLALHASAVAFDGAGVLFLGGPNAGKSTLAARAQARGARLLADDLAVVRLDDAGHPWILPGAAELKLWPDSLAALGLDRAAPPRLRADSEKRVLRFPAPVDPAPVPLRAIYLLALGHGPAITTARVEGAARGAALLHHTYRSEFIGGAENQKRHFAQIARLATLPRFTRLSRPHDCSYDDALVDRIVAEVRR
jgi:hypothetical protein